MDAVIVGLAAVYFAVFVALLVRAWLTPPPPPPPPPPDPFVAFIEATRRFSVGMSQLAPAMQEATRSLQDLRTKLRRMDGRLSPYPPSRREKGQPR